MDIHYTESFEGCVALAILKRKRAEQKYKEWIKTVNLSAIICMLRCYNIT